MSGADRCPYVGRFDSCAAFDEEQFSPRTSTEEPLRPVRTCAHLTAGEAERGRFYPRCSLGDDEARRRHASGAPAGQAARARTA